MALPATQKRVIESREAAQVPVVSAPGPVAKPATVARFWKVVNPHQKIVFKDGSTLVFGRQAFVTADPELTQKINEVKDQFGILPG